MAPPMACLTFEWREEDGTRSGPKIVHWTQAEDILASALNDPNVLLVGQNIAYDMAVYAAQFPALVPLIFKAYEEDRVTDTMLRQKILDIAWGIYRGKFEPDGTWTKINYSLFDITRRLTGKVLKKDGWRMRYGEFRDVPIEKWVDKAKELQEQARAALAAGSDDKDLAAIVADPPEQVILYPLEDASTTMDCFLKQEHPNNATILKPQFHEARSAFVLHLSSCWGMRTNPDAVEELRRITELQLSEITGGLIEAGLVRKDGSRDTKKAAGYMEEFCTKSGIRIRRTKTGGVSLDEESCLATEDPLLIDYARYTGLNKMLTADYEMLKKGSVHPVHTHYDLAESSRTTSSGPNLQNVSKK